MADYNTTFAYESASRRATRPGFGGGRSSRACLLVPSPAAAKMRYAAVRTATSSVLTDRTTDTAVSILPSLGNMAFEMKVRGHNVLRYPHATIDEFRKAPNTIGIPFMGPWINRLDEQAFYANGKRYPFDMTLGNVRGTDPDPRLRDHDGQVAGRRHEGDQGRRVRHQPPRLLQAAGLDEAVAVRPHRRDDLPAEGRRPRGRDGSERTCRPSRCRW